MSGAPFDLLETLTTPKTAAAGRQAVAAERELSSVKKELRQLVSSLRYQTGRKERRYLEKALRSQSAEHLANIPAFEQWRDKLLGIARAADAVDQALPDELTAPREHLRDIARKILPRYLVFADPAMR